MNDFAETLIIAAITAVLVGVGTFLITDDNWRSDCSQLGAHLTGNTVFKCEPVKPTK